MGSFFSQLTLHTGGPQKVPEIPAKVLAVLLAPPWLFIVKET